jgi:hypothetical protein
MTTLWTVMRPKAGPLATTAVAVAMLATAIAGCGGDDASPTTTVAPGDSVPETTIAPTTSETATTSGAATTTSGAATTTSGAATTTSGAATATTLAGESIDFFFREGDVVGVIGVAFDDVLNVRTGPGVDYGIVAGLDPTADDVVSTGAARQIPSGAIWVEIDAGGITGWSNVRYLSYLGATGDITSDVVDDLGELPEAETMLDLGMAVAATRASEDEPVSDITVSVEPSAGDVGEVTIDVVGLGDDAVRGERLHIFGAPIEGGDGFSLMSVEATVMCGRGVTDDGVCV